MKLIDSFRRSAAQLRDLRSLTGASLLLALSILLTYFFGYTFNAMLAGVIYGVFLYGKKPTLLRVVATKATINIVINAFLATLWMALLGGKGFYAMIPVRIIKNLTMIPIESAILYAVLNAASQALRRAGYYKIRE